MVGVDITSLNLPEIADKLKLEPGQRADNISTILGAGYSHKQAAYIAEWIERRDKPNFGESRTLEQNPWIPDSLAEISQTLEAGLVAKADTQFTATPKNLLPEENVDSSAIVPATATPEESRVEPKKAESEPVKEEERKPSLSEVRSRLQSQREK